ncbi:MAG: hypothetical protein DMF14_07280 [Verrucomicrobia bacterium]|nr:MAG: hypothetical protein DMF14_07280 [Verrucomicrobiota bacterium]
MPVLAASSSPSDRTYSVAVGVILVAAALEILAIAIHFGAEYRAERATLQSLKRPAVSTSAKPEATPLPAQPDAPSSVALSASDHLLKEANVLREHGDTANAEIRRCWRKWRRFTNQSNSSIVLTRLGGKFRISVHRLAHSTNWPT